ncbi:hypothetical protein CENSYa_1071 [Cenarchaeum symbiosum A]|uniref:Uncharacterized protein n=1 Tax=Cenarchaeum symbiosum (strain A) TaxID=414004 RepID=A0RWI4_CENSY|nr:hypothetical protein CENSYa_1071 [Cenarchaeum symbiosum A]
MSLLLSKNDLKEIVCKFKNHIVDQDTLRYIVKHPEETRDTICERCNFAISVRLNPKNTDYCLISDLK